MTYPQTPLYLTSEIRSSEQDSWNAQLDFFNHIFYTQLYPAYDLPKKLQEDTELETEQENQMLNQVGNINYTHDFSLSHEIDDLIRELFGVGTPQKL
ncbi:ASN_collapsed_G0052960.mRNA.1.CDS.1 [Saccharomyces cerevisiae]|nr:ASN_collapsed_G0052960.mRNA.1.CDS.1 [Saccharomyces cerevisiae]